MCISARDDSLSWPMQMSSWLAIICRAAKKLPGFPRPSPFKTLLSPRRAMHCRPQKRMGSETHLTMCLFLIIFFLVSSSNQLFTFCSGFSTELGKDSVAIIASRWYFIRMSFCLFLKLTPVYERVVNKSAVIFPAMHRYHQSTMFTKYSVY